jgi:hypothetical protein
VHGGPGCERRGGEGGVGAGARAVSLEPKTAHQFNNGRPYLITEEKSVGTIAKQLKQFATFETIWVFYFQTSSFYFQTNENRKPKMCLYSRF